MMCFELVITISLVLVYGLPFNQSNLKDVMFAVGITLLIFCIIKCLAIAFGIVTHASPFAKIWNIRTENIFLIGMLISMYIFIILMTVICVYVCNDKLFDWC